MVWIDDRWGMNTKEAIKAFNKMAEYAHAYGYSTLATGNYSHAEGCSSSLPCRQPTIEYKYEHKVEEVDVLEKVRREIEEWLKEPGISCQANLEADLLGKSTK